MPDPHFQEVADGVFCIETGLYRHGLAAAYLVRAGDRLAFVDTGTSNAVPLLMAVVERLGLTPGHVDYVIPTHVHLDHAGGAGALMALCPHAELVVHPKGAPHLIDPARLTAGATAVYGPEAFARDFGDLTPVPAQRVVPAEDGMVIDLAGRLLTFIDTPGHANHHGCIFDDVSGGCFTGDTFGISYRELDTVDGPWVYAPTTPVAFDPDVWQASIDRILAFNPRGVFLTHYGRVDHPQALEDDLRRSIRSQAEIALGEEARDPEGRDERLRTAVAEHLVGEARRHCGTLDEVRVRELLAVDIDLNAQGLAVWLSRRARQAAG